MPVGAIGVWLKSNGLCSCAHAESLGLMQDCSRFECEFSLGQQFVPKVDGKVFVGAAETGNGMIHKSANSMLCCIAVMEVWWHE